MSRSVKLAVIAGDGIGPEVVAEALKVLDAATATEPVTFDLTHFSLGATRFLGTGDVLTDDDLAAISAHDAILLGASHSHSSGPIVWILPGEFDHASPLVRRLAYEQSTCIDPRYLARVEQALVDAVTEAHDRRVEAKGGVGRGVIFQDRGVAVGELAEVVPGLAALRRVGPGGHFGFARM